MRTGLFTVIAWAGALALADGRAWAANPLHTVSGAPVHWTTPEIRVAADPASPSKSIPAESVAEAIAEAAAAWNVVPEWKLRFAGADPAAPLVAVRVRFCKGIWPAAAGLLAHTEYEADATTGVVTSAVILVDECDYRFVGPTEVEEGAFDLQAVLTHELGHVLGLGHSADPKAVMFPSTGTARQRRPTLDDRAGVAALYGTPAPAPDAGVPAPRASGTLASSLVPPLAPPFGAPPRPRAPTDAIGSARLDAGDLVLYTGELVLLPAMERAEPPVAAPVRSPERARRRPPNRRPR